MTISDRFVDQCSPAIGVSNATCGSITRSSIAHLNKTDLDDIFKPGGLFADLDFWFLHQIEMKACGIKRYGLYEWIMANADRKTFRAAVSGQKVAKGPGLLYPFIKGYQESVINNDYWYVLNGVAAGGGTYTVGAVTTAIGTMSAGPLTAFTAATDAGGTSVTGTRIIRVQNRHSIPYDPTWFRPREVLHIFTKSAAGQTLSSNYRVLRSAANTAGTYIDILLADENGGSTTPYDTAPTTGVFIVGINNVNDFEKWCNNLPTIDPRKQVPFWWQVWRQGRCVDSFYREVYARLFDANPAFREFGDLPLAQRNAQDEQVAQRRFVNAFFFQKAISANQTLTAWESLDLIETITPSVLVDSTLNGKPVGRRANFIGVKEQLNACSRVLDLANNPLNIYEFLDENYNIKRARESTGRRITDIDWWCNSKYRARIQKAMFAYYKNEFGDNFRITYELGKSAQEGELGWTYDSYTVPYPAGIRINFVTDPFFDDIFDEFNARSMPSVGNLLLCLDIGLPPNGSIYYAQIAANRKTYLSAKIEELAKYDPSYRCVMENPTVEQSLYSEAGTVVIECPLQSLWCEGIADADPITTGRSGSYSDLY